MGGSLTAVLASLDVGTLFFIAICVTVLLGLFLLHAWMHEGNPALAWWSLAYLIGGASGALWRLGDVVAPVLPPGTSTVLLFVAVGMTWSGARSFHGRPICWSAMAFGSAFWVIASFFPAFAESAESRIVVSALIVAGYTFLTAAELRRERRKSLIRRWPAIFVPMLHGAIFLFPVALATICCTSDAGQSSARGWIAVFAIVILLYVVGTASIVLILAKDRAVDHYKMAAATDPLTGLLNRRGFLEAAGSLMAIRRRQRMAPVSVLVLTSIASKRSTTKVGMRPATRCFNSLRRSCAKRSAQPILSVARVVKNSSLCCRALRPKRPLRPSACGQRVRLPASCATAAELPRRSAWGWHRVHRRPRSINDHTRR